MLKRQLRRMALNPLIPSTAAAGTAKDGAAKDGAQPISLMAVVDDYYKTFTINYRGGVRYAHLVRNDQVPDYLDDLIKSKVGGP